MTTSGNLIIDLREKMIDMSMTPRHDFKYDGMTFCSEAEPLEHFVRCRSRQIRSAAAPKEMQN